MRSIFLIVAGALAIASTDLQAQGLSCAVDKPGTEEPSYYACVSVWPEGPSSTTAFFYLSHHLLGDGSSPPVTWSDSRCPNQGSYACALPIWAYSPLTLQTSFTHFGTVYTFEAQAIYELGY
jgi:hypothetical protein